MKRIISALLIISSLGLSGCNKDIKATNATNQIQNSKIEYYFPRAGQHPENQLIDVINGSNKTLDIAIYSLTKQDIVDSIINAKRRGVAVRIITDKIESKSKSQNQELSLIKSSGIPVKINSHSGLMHLKVTVADKNIVTTGSYNYSENATKENDEVLVIINDSKVATDFDNEFETMWNDSNNFKDY